MSSLTLRDRYELRAGGRVNLRPWPLADRLFVAWLLERLRAGARYHELLVAVAAPGAYPLRGSMEIDDALRGDPLFRVASDVVARAAEREGASADELRSAQPGVYRSVSEAARTLGISRAAVAQAIHEGRLAAYRTG
ncbi:MAG: excisionase family DNA-binding protein [Myxococcota bacterium]